MHCVTEQPPSPAEGSYEAPYTPQESFAYAGTGGAATFTSTVCWDCHALLDPGAKFCGGCGSVVRTAQANFDFSARGHKRAATAPSFAPVSRKHRSAPSPELQAEAGKLMLLLARERLFLYMHWIICLSVHFFGFWLTWVCYVDYIGDELTRLMMASTPLLYINLTALICFVPIRGTRKEISRLKEKLNYVRFQIEYNHLL